MQSDLFDQNCKNFFKNLPKFHWRDVYQFQFFEVFQPITAYLLLVNFVKIEPAWMHVVFSKEYRKKYKPPWNSGTSKCIG
jgi:hypothetical protein